MKVLSLAVQKLWPRLKFFVYGRQQRQSRRRRGYDNSSPDFCHGELNMITCVGIPRFALTSDLATSESMGGSLQVISKLWSTIILNQTIGGVTMVKWFLYNFQV